MVLLDAQHLRKSYGRTVAVDDVSFQVTAGEIFGLLGPNGAGKSTTMMMIAGLLRPDAGTVRIGGQVFATGRAARAQASGAVQGVAAGLDARPPSGPDAAASGGQNDRDTPKLTGWKPVPQKVPVPQQEPDLQQGPSPRQGSVPRLRPVLRRIRMRIGVVPQDLAVYPELTARENLVFFGGLYRVSGARLAERIAAVLDMTGLAPHADARVETFSGGMKRRLNLGVALIHEPELLILDEPTVGVDPQSRAHLLACMKTLSGRGMGIIYASHYMEEVQTLCRRVAIMDHGRIVACDTLDTLLRRVAGRVELRVTGWRTDLAERITGWAEVASVEGGRADLVIPQSPHDGGSTPSRTLARLLDVLGETGVEVQAIRTFEPNLERLFLELTGHALRD